MWNDIKAAWKAICPDFTKLWKDIVADFKALLVDIYNFLKNTIWNALKVAFTTILAPLKTTWAILGTVIFKTLLVCLKYLWKWIVSWFK